MLLAMWAAGLAAGGSVVAGWRVVGRGYVWLTAAVATAVGVALSLVAGGVPAWVATGAAAAAALQASRPAWVVAAFATAGALFVAAGWGESAVLPLLTGAVFLGGVTTEMMLGHWFLVDPTLPRWSLHRLAVVGGIGLSADALYLLTQGLVSGATADPVLGWAYLALTVMTLILILGVVFSLREPGYTGVMAATGLSYLAVLTAFGVAVVGRMLAT